MMNDQKETVGTLMGEKIRQAHQRRKNERSTEECYHGKDCPFKAEAERLRAKNDVHSKDFESKIDSFFTSKTKVKDHLTRAASIRIGGKWT
jgi:superoxide dismutase